VCPGSQKVQLYQAVQQAQHCKWVRGGVVPLLCSVLHGLTSSTGACYNIRHETVPKCPKVGYKGAESSRAQDTPGAAEVPGFSSAQSRGAEGRPHGSHSSSQRAELNSALCDSSRARGNGVELSGQGELGVRERVCTRGRCAWNSLLRAVGMAPNAGTQGAFGQHSQTLGLDFGRSCVEPGVALHDPCGYRPTWDIL